MNLLQNIQIDKIVFGGQAMARREEGQKVLFVWNALPGEVVDVEITKQKKTYLEGIAIDIKKASPDRVEPKEAHYLSSSPWQIISWEKELEWKKKMAEETYHDIGKFDLPNELELVADQNRQFGYRNKMEYSFTEDDNGEISLAFFKRGHKQKIPIKHSQLAHPWLNSTAQQILDWINKTDMTTRNLKSLIIRSNEKKETIAGLFIKDELFFQDYPELNETLKGFQLYYSTHKSPASVPTKLIYSEGQDNLKESITPPNHQTAKGQQQKASLNLSYGLFSFFQVNVPLFETVLTDMLPYLDRDIEVVDFYSGVGAIGLSLADHFKIGTLVDNVDEAIEFAVQNIEENNVTNCQAFASPAEKMTELITSDKTIIFDPPRAGLHKNVVRKVLEEKPPTILYLSCNLSTQARDIEMLKDVYQPTFVKLYNFFPRTPHIEGLVVIVKRKD